MSSERATQEQVDSAYRRAGELLVRGVPADGVKHVLVRRGWSESSAAAIVTDAVQILGTQIRTKRKPRRRRAQRAWLALAVTLLLAAGGVAALVTGGFVARPAEGGHFDFTSLPRQVQVGFVLLAAAVLADLYTLSAAVRARRSAPHPTLRLVMVLAVLGLLAAVGGAAWLALPYLR